MGLMTPGVGAVLKCCCCCGGCVPEVLAQDPFSVVGPLTSTPVGGLPWVDVGATPLSVETDGLVTGLAQQAGAASTSCTVSSPGIRYMEATSVGLCSVDGNAVGLYAGAGLGLDGLFGLEFSGSAYWTAYDDTLTALSWTLASVGDRLRLASNGTDMLAYVNGLLVAQWTPVALGNEQWGFFSFGGGTTTEPLWSDFELGTVCPAGCCEQAPPYQEIQN